MMGAYGQVEILAATIAIGILLGVIFDLYRILRRALGFRSFLTTIGDLLYWFVATIATFAVMLLVSWGEMRFYVFVAIAGGLLLYLRYASSFVIKILR